MEGQRVDLVQTLAHLTGQVIEVMNSHHTRSVLMGTEIGPDQDRLMTSLDIVLTIPALHSSTEISTGQNAASIGLLHQHLIIVVVSFLVGQGALRLVEQDRQVSMLVSVNPLLRM